MRSRSRARGLGAVAIVLVAGLAAGLVAACCRAPGPSPEVPEPVGTATVPPAAPVPGPTAAPSAGSPSEELKVVFVRDALIDCEGVGPRQCLQVRSDEAAPWELFYDDIEGFSFEAGRGYELRVRVRRDGERVRYELVEVIAEQPASP